ncbi:MAG: sulfotransferase [Anaerolineae bacterium]|nr:sulfotransferase [Anaerolineae bacterium]
MAEVLYIAGYGRSGSTVLDVLLGNHPAMFGAGELTNFFEEWLRGGLCSCGNLYPECVFWQEVMNHLHSVIPGMNPSVAAQVTRRLESTLTWKRSLTGSNVSDRQFYGQLWGAMIAAIAQVSGKSIIVDSSKSTRASARRALCLTRLCGLDVKAIHLVRDPRATMWSLLRGSNVKLERGQPAALRGGVARALIGWGITNLSVHLQEIIHPQLKVYRLRYEDLVSDPVQELHKLGAFLDMDLGPVEELIVNGCALHPGHGVAGNRVRRQGPVRLKPDEAWKTLLPAYARKLAWLTWPLAYRYGYDVLQ